MLNRREFAGIAAGALVAASVAGRSARAADVPEGTVIDAASIDGLRGQTFQGKLIGDMLPERLEWQIRKHGLAITLRRTKEIPLDPAYVAASKANAGKVTLDPATKLLAGWSAGLPFPDVAAGDPNAGVKLMWNNELGAPVRNMSFPLFAYLLVDGDKGLEREQHWNFTRYISSGAGDHVANKTMLVAQYPFDLKGTGLFSIRYDDGRLDDGWAYLRSVRRVRKLSGGTWMDPVGSTDQLNDDLEVFNANPTWYKSFKVIGKRWVLAVANSRWPVWNEDSDDPNKAFIGIDLASKPYWNIKNDYEPREVYVIEATPPDEHPYSRKVLYMETRFPRIYYSETYDRKGEFWKFLNFQLRPVVGLDGTPAVITACGNVIDFQRNHATVFVTGKQAIINDPKMTTDTLSIGVLESVSR